MRNRHLRGPYSRKSHAQGPVVVLGGWAFLMGEVPLQPAGCLVRPGRELVEAVRGMPEVVRDAVPLQGPAAEPCQRGSGVRAVFSSVGHQPI
ncbi:hypothetical protein T484DRAFT_3401592 [Baffinella frigidus]|nr:hypothetical protein T484DRAFT_3401592 [Cryptophyta sp. CCMP2293]